jgi:translation initiation factor IF-1
MSNADKIELEGKVIESNGDFFKVEISEGYIVDCKIAGKLRKLGIQILLLDNVRVEVSPYNTMAGRIVYRLK